MDVAFVIDSSASTRTIKRSGFGTIDTLEEFFEAVGRETRGSVSNLIPYKPTYEQARDMVASEEHDDYMEGVSIEQLVQHLVVPSLSKPFQTTVNAYALRAIVVLTVTCVLRAIRIRTAMVCVVRPAPALD